MPLCKQINKYRTLSILRDCWDEAAKLGCLCTLGAIPEQVNVYLAHDDRVPILIAY
jgi:hypothetical protein